MVEPFVKAGALWVPNQEAAERMTAADVLEAAAKYPAPPSRVPDDVTADIRTFLDGLVRRPIEGGWVSEKARQKAVREHAARMTAWRVCFALTHGHRVPNPPKVKRKKMSKHEGPRWYDENGKLKPGMPEGAYLRVRTVDAMVETTEHRPAKNGVDWDQSIKVYGPFETADKQREFMCNAFRGTVKPGPKLDRIIEQMMAWRRYDEVA